jgi:glycine betaine/choline ABC-type transport system substrate-binding protein
MTRALFGVLILLGAGCRGRAESTPRVVVGSKNFTESVILGELVAQQLERFGLEVTRKLDLGGTFVCHEAMIAGDLDVYVEYTGTAHGAILELATERDPAVVREEIAEAYRERWNLEWARPLGFENTFAMLVRRETAQRLGIATLSEAIPHASDLHPGFGYEFVERADGYHGLEEWYGIDFPDPPSVMDLGLTYRALAEGVVDIIAGNSTDGQIESLGLVPLRDDRHYFPPYEAAPVVRAEALEQHPGLAAALSALAGMISNEEMRRLNYLVDVEQRAPRTVVSAFLDRLSRAANGGR